MSKDNNILRPTVWRDPRNRDIEETGVVQDRRPDGCVLVMVENQGNRQQLTNQLARVFKVIEATDGTLPGEEFDLAIVDGPAFRRSRLHLGKAKESEQPVFLPVMLLLPRKDLRKRASRHLDLVDEFIVTPIDGSELYERVSMLLRTRQLAKEQRAELAYIVNHDGMTGLPAQSLFMDRLQTAVQNATLLNQDVHVVVIHIPLGRVMKSLGHRALQRAIQICAVRLQRLFGERASLARLTTDDWGLLPPAGISVDDVTHLCRQLRRLGDEPIEVAEERIRLSAYIGIGIYPHDAVTATETLNAAFGALSRAREPDEPYFYSRDLQVQALQYLRTEAALHDALAQDQFELWFQPQFRLDTLEIMGAEALVRWRLPTGELVPPDEFIPVAESSGLVQPIDRWVLEEACGALGRWRERGSMNLRIAVNITPQDIADPDFIPWIKNLFERHNVPPPWLEIELTETMFCDTSEAVLGKLNHLREYGVTVAIDDFGTGYSSLSYIHRLPINVLKIDKSFTDRLPGDETSEGITMAIIGLAHQFGLDIVAEGIEIQEQIDYLHKHGVHAGQGFLVARPMPEAEFLAYLDTR